MRIKIFIALLITIASGGILKDDIVPGIEIESHGNAVRYITPESNSPPSSQNTTIYDRSRAEVLWVDRNHQFAIAEHVSLSGNGMSIQAGWWLNNKRTSHYRTLGNNVAVWVYQLPLTEWYIPVDVSFSGEDIAVGSTGEPFYSFASSNNAPK
ncbi:MAG: hypothetical protein N3A65_09145, partial [candidate division WOR-3 bacterium]|nr:hypothetical protein [candidate division WOR-3 bacterium]